VKRLRGRLSGEAGYTLIEMLTVLAILGTVLGALVTVFVTGSNAESNLNARFQAQLQARQALDKFRREVHCASAVTYSTSSVTLTLPTPTAGSQPCPTGTGAFTWRTCLVATNRYGFYRIPGANAVCGAAGATRWADYLVSPNTFPSPTYYPPTSTSRARLHVAFPVNPTPTKPGTYTLTDDVVLQNSPTG
jgi:prepilin-type N-terminal cleavage/methylation domain-containing protein